MACSKLFSGDLPELINEVIQYFHYDYKTLHSCIFVNRLWCRLTIPLLWEDPFSIKSPKNYRFIESYLHYLNNDDKVKFNDYIINNDLFPSNTLFNYPRFIQRLDTHKVCNFIEKWAVTVGSTSTTKEQHSSYFIQNTNLSSSQMSNFTKLVIRSLFLIFIENGVSLHSFEVIMFNHKEFEYFDEIFELILQNPNFIYNIKSFKLDFNTITNNITRFSTFLYSNCNSISSLHFLFPSYVENYPTEKCLAQIISSQENLKKILFGYSEFPLHHSLLSLKHSNCSNTLNTIIFYHIDFGNIVVLSEAFNHLNVLESIHIIYCYSLDSKFIQQINNITKPFKLKSLFLGFLGEVDESLERLIQKSGDYLENFGISNDESQQLLQLIMKYCSKIKYLGPIRLDNQSIYLLLSLIENITQNLSYLIIDAFNVDYSSIILKNLGQILPIKLEYMYLCLTINTSDLEVFLKNSQNTFIKKLLIRNIRKEESGDIFSYIKEYIMKKKKVKYLAVSETFHGRNEDLFFQKDKVKEFQLHDIQVLKYFDLFIDIYDFINETY
ncbi:hypothetical protein RhiirC2_787382 [Rhizophagus irregularis]|uniref:F-box domain-containing protein n=1 Tax=Rhizophagus irregularis TaxID=588596 RepID=A0A2N1MSE4_9GLOM|nr:hypothetical protein RhiirC2_787382 [Rhizophagus irregularis]